jgi:hypothetical protein
MVIRQSLWSFDASLRNEIAGSVRRMASRRRLGPKFRSVTIVRTENALSLDFLYFGSDRHSARQDSWTLIRDVAADVYARARIAVVKGGINFPFSQTTSPRLMQ